MTENKHPTFLVKTTAGDIKIELDATKALRIEGGLIRSKIICQVKSELLQVIGFTDNLLRWFKRFMTSRALDVTWRCSRRA